MNYMPKQGDIVFLDFNPQAGHEQKGTRPALVVSNNVYNNFTRIAMVCPITNTDRGFPLHVKLDDNLKTTGVVMCEQVKVLDVQARNICFCEKVSEGTLEEIIDILKGFIDIV